MTTRPRLLSILLCIAGLAASAARAAPPPGPDEPRLVRVALGAGLEAADLVDAGLLVVGARGGEARVLARAGDLERLARLGAAAVTIDPHPGRSLAARARAERDAAPAGGAPRMAGVQSHPPFGSGSMGGYWTTAEIKALLDHLVAADPHDLVADRIDTIGVSVQGRPIWGLRIARAVSETDTRPVTFMNALTHACEPASMQTLLYFVEDLLSRYGTDPFATYLLEHRVLYVVPLVNPDGYARNEATWTGSGGTQFGLWRKNARDNNGNLVFDDGDGVDLNRNFTFQWGGAGSSSDPSSEAYRGPTSASEPETQSQQNIVAVLRPVTGLSFHAFGDWMLFPWSYTSAAPPAAAALREWTDELTRDSGYLGGQSPNVFNASSGVFADWCYGDTLTKPRMVAWTPEIGSENDDFWPPPSRLLPMAQENLRAGYVALAIAGPWVQEDGVTIAEGAMNAGHLTHLAVRARNLGITGTAGPGLAGTLTALDTGVRVFRATVPYPTLGSLQSADPGNTFQVAVDDTVTPGRPLRFRIAFTAPGGFYSADTLAIPCGTATVLAFDDASGTMIKWSPGSWNIVSNDPAHPSRYFADSPAGPYADDVDNSMRLLQTLNLTGIVHAYVLFEARWDLEPDFDGAFVEASPNGIAWTALRSTGSTPASGYEKQVPAGAPVFAGSRFGWRAERADLRPFTGLAGVRVRFRMSSDLFNFRPHDGIAVDSVRIVVYDPAAQPNPVAVGDGPAPSSIELAAPSPNPARGRVRLEFALPAAGPARLEILDLQGRRVRSLAGGALAAGRYVRGWDLADDAGRPVAPGVYLARLRGAGGQSVRRLVIGR